MHHDVHRDHIKCFCSSVACIFHCSVFRLRTWIGCKTSCSRFLSVPLALRRAMKSHLLEHNLYVVLLVLPKGCFVGLFISTYLESIHLLLAFLSPEVLGRQTSREARRRKQKTSALRKVSSASANTEELQSGRWRPGVPKKMDGFAWVPKLV